MLGKYVDVAGGAEKVTFLGGASDARVSRRSRCPDAVVTGGANDGAFRWSPEASDAVVLCACTRSAPGARRGRSRVEGRASVGVRGLGRDGEVDVGLLSGPPPATTC